MWIKVYIVLGLIGVFVIGYFRLRRELNSIRKDLNYINDYRNKFVQLVNSYYESGYEKKFDGDLYHWLTLNSVRAQKVCGGLARGTLVGPFQMYISRNHEFIINTVPKFRDGSVDSYEINTTDDMLLRTVGVFQNLEDDILKDLKNPIKWFQQGVSFCLNFPVLLLKWFGIINNQTVRKISSNKLIKVINGIAGLIIFLSAVVTILAGWDASIDWLKRIFHIQ